MITNSLLIFYYTDNRIVKVAVILNASVDGRFMFEKSFNSVSSYDIVLNWATNIKDCSKIVVLSSKENFDRCKIGASNISKNISVKCFDELTIKTLLLEFVNVSEEASSIVYSFADCPFINKNLTEKLLDTHSKYFAEYTFADGYPYGLSPEIIDKGGSKIILALADKKSLSDKIVCRDSIMSVLKTEINSFEIETVISPKDWRLYRFSFDCSSKATFRSCCAIYNSGVDIEDEVLLSDSATKNISVIKTVPQFYNIQISCDYDFDICYSPLQKQFENEIGNIPKKNMTLEQFSSLVKQIVDFSDSATISLSAWGEAFTHPNFIDFIKIVSDEKNISLLVETNGLNVTKELCEKIKEVVPTNFYFIVSLDAMTEETYKKIHKGCGTLSDAIAGFLLLQKYFPENTYAQMTRINDNENELESFYRYWSNEENGGKFIIQKYDSFCALLPDLKPADLSPIERNPCWHIRRDMTILADGNVPMCREFVFNNFVGNVFTENLCDIWEKITPLVLEHLNCKYDGKCGKCDEYYTFNF